MSDKTKPLVLDVDGTLLKTDMLYESFWAAMGKDPAGTIKALWQNKFSRPKMKAALAELAELDVTLLPIRGELVELVDRERKDGRDVVLASAADAGLVEELAKSVGLPGPHFGSTEDLNLKGVAKAEHLVSTYGEGGFDYAGDSKADMHVWERADNAILVGDPSGATARLSGQGKKITKIEGGWHFKDLIRALRPHQWVKNVLLFLPMLAAHQFSVDVFFRVILGVISFSAAASSIYIVNDLLDLEADRRHATKFKRPFASGAVPIPIGMATCLLLVFVALGIGSVLGATFFGVVAFYMFLSLTYSLRLKQARWIDIATLATLYTLRVVAGAAASAVYVSGFMIVFIFPVFITLGCVKRLTELTLATSDERLPGRGYARTDRSDLLNVGWIGIIGALVTFLLYSLSDQAAILYPIRWLLWVAMIPLAMWLYRMLRLGYFGKQDYDPIVFAMRDKRGLGLVLITLSLMFYAAGLWQRWLGW